MSVHREQAVGTWKAAYQNRRGQPKPGTERKDRRRIGRRYCEAVLPVSVAPLPGLLQNMAHPSPCWVVAKAVMGATRRGLGPASARVRGRKHGGKTWPNRCFGQ